MEYVYHTSGSSPRYYPAWAFICDLYLADDQLTQRKVMPRNNMKSDWGEASAVVMLGGTDSKPCALPQFLRVIWLSVAEAKCYKLERYIDSEEVAKIWEQKDSEGNPVFRFVVVGMTPYGGTALWIRGERKSVLIDWATAEEVNPYTEETGTYFAKCTPEQFSALVLKRDEACLSYLNENGLPPRDLFDRWMKQYFYRYRALEEFWDGEGWQHYDEEDFFYDDMAIQYIREERYDGTHYDMGDTELMRYHLAGIAKRMAISWKEGRKNFEAFFWFDYDAMAKALERQLFFDPEVKPTLLLRLDTRNKQHSLAIEGDSTTAAVTIPQEAYELLVFQGENELWRSPNFSKEDESEWDW